MTDEDTGTLGKLILSAAVIVATPVTEVVTGAAPLGVIGGLTALVVIWAGDPEEVADEI